ncbi:MAG TPA: EamA family transporter, partial [Thermomicrobiales bacterium]|nr:EamA family transporter [Thermomicrobiales bacterium]
LALPIALRGGAPPAPTRRSLVPVVAAAGLLDVASLVFLNPGVERTDTATTALSRLFGDVTAFLAWLFLRERLAPHQWAGVAIVTLGILLVSL